MATKFVPAEAAHQLWTCDKCQASLKLDAQPDFWNRLRFPSIKSEGEAYTTVDLCQKCSQKSIEWSSIKLKG